MNVELFTFRYRQIYSINCHLVRLSLALIIAIAINISEIVIHYFLLPIHGSESFVFGKNFRNRGFDGFNRFEVL